MNFSGKQDAGERSVPSHAYKRHRSGLIDQESVIVLGDVHDQAVQ